MSTGGQFLALLSASMTFWLVQASLITFARLVQVRCEIAHWMSLTPERRRAICSVIGLFSLTTFVAIQRGRSTMAWMQNIWGTDFSSLWYLPIGVIGTLFLLWWAFGAVLGTKRGRCVWWISFVGGIGLGVLAGVFTKTI